MTLAWIKNVKFWKHFPKYKILIAILHHNISDSLLLNVQEAIIKIQTITFWSWNRKSCHQNNRGNISFIRPFILQVVYDPQVDLLRYRVMGQRFYYGMNLPMTSKIDGFWSKMKLIKYCNEKNENYIFFQTVTIKYFLILGNCMIPWCICLKPWSSLNDFKT